MIKLKFVVASLALSTVSSAAKREDSKRPNIIYILADDLGYGDLGCYGQHHIKTPNIDKLAAQGMLFTQHYTGSAVSAPSRSVLMTGQHTGNTFIRGNGSTKPGGTNLPLNVVTVAELLKGVGYATGAFGKWGLGMQDTPGHPNKQGFDEFFGYLSQSDAHRYYPKYLIHNNEEFQLEGNDLVNKVTFSPDLIQLHALQFIKDNKDKPFFMFVPSIIPHAELVIPEDSIFKSYDGKFEEKPWGFEPTANVLQGNPYGAPNFEMKGYAPIAKPRATFAAMVSRLDKQVGEIMILLDQLGLSENTLIMFSSDNGPHKEGGADPDFFNSNGVYKGYKRDLYEGGIRTPMIASWPSTIKAGTKSDLISAFWDVMPTLADIAGVKIAEKIDGISFLPTLKGNKKAQKAHEYMYWEFYEQGGKIAVRKGKWKAVRLEALTKKELVIELYDLSTDPGETKNVASQFPNVVNEMIEIMKSARTESPYYDFSVNWN